MPSIQYVGPVNVSYGTEVVIRTLDYTFEGQRCVVMGLSSLTLGRMGIQPGFFLFPVLSFSSMSVNLFFCLLRMVFTCLHVRFL